VGRRVAVVLPLGQRSTATYNAVGNILTQTDFNGKTTAFVYDSLNRLTAKQFEAGTQWSFTYTATGQQDIVTLLDTNQQVMDRYNYDYNERDWLVKRSDFIGGVERSISYTYDLAGNRTSTTTPSSTVFYTFDERNRLDTVLQNGTILADYDYDANNRLITTTFGNGTQEIRQYDLLNRLTYIENWTVRSSHEILIYRGFQIQDCRRHDLSESHTEKGFHQKAIRELRTLKIENHKGNTTLSSYAYTLDKVGNRIKVVEQDGRTVDYSYDNLYRLTKEQITDPAYGNRSSDFAYDKVGNRLIQAQNISGVVTTTTYSYDANDRILQEVTDGQVSVIYSYDADGNTISKQDENGSTLYTWNDEGRLVGAVVLDTNDDIKNQMEYRYNNSGNRVISIVDGQKTNYLIDTSHAYDQILEEYIAFLMQVRYS
jgi:YD repeat-containing protein